MAKKVVVKKVIKKTPIKIAKKNNNVEEILVENFVSLQRVMTNLSVKFDNLSTQISKLLELFEISAKTLAEKTYDSKDNENGGEIVEKSDNLLEQKSDNLLEQKLDNLIEQNKVIARGLTLLHESSSPQLPPQQLKPPINPIGAQPKPQNPNVKMNEYQKSISSTPQNETRGKNF
jgi:hypothetical protein|tara:strand:+ start:850 stop:1374 length:525 start_codon:yes stop_codon:yes gene_type:complete